MSILDKLLNRFLLKAFIPNKKNFLKGINNIAAKYPAFLASFPEEFQSYDFRQFKLNNPDLIEKFIQIYGDEEKRPELQALAAIFIRSSNNMYLEGQQFSKEKLKELANFANLVVTPSQAQKHIIKGANQLNQDMALDMPLLNLKGVCSELSGLWVDAKMGNSAEEADFKRAINILSKYDKNRRLLTKSEQLCVLRQIQKLVETSPRNNKDIGEQNNYRKIRKMNYQNTHVMVASTPAALLNVLRKAITIDQHPLIQTGKLYRFSANGHTVKILQKKGILYYFDSNDPAGEHKYKKVTQGFAKKVFDDLKDEQGNPADTYTVDIYPLTASRKQNIDDQHAHFEAALIAAKDWNEIAKNPQAAHYIAQYEEGFLCQTVLLRNLLIFFGRPVHEEGELFTRLANQFLNNEQTPFLITPDNSQPNLFTGAKVLKEAAIAGELGVFEREDTALWVEASQNSQLSLLAIALRRGYENIAEKLLDMNPNLEEKIGSKNLTLIELAARSGLLRVLTRLIDAKAPFSELEQGIFPVLVIAIQNKQTRIAEYLLSYSQENKLLNAQQLKGLALYAAEVGNITVLKALEKYPADFSGVAHEAAKYNQLEVLSYLCKKNGDPLHEKDGKGYTPLYYAALNGHSALVQAFGEMNPDYLFVLNEDKTSILHAAALSEKTGIFSFFDEKHTAHNEDLYISPHGNWPLHTAIKAGKLVSVQYLLKNYYNDLSAQVLQDFVLYAINNNQREVVGPLLAAGLKADEDFLTYFENLDSLKQLLNCDTDILDIFLQGESLLKALKAKDKEDLTLLHHACKEGKVDIVRYLVEKGADVSAKDNQNNTPLHCALSTGNGSLLPILCGSIHIAKAINVGDSENKTALHKAWDCTEEEIGSLLTAGADLNKEDAQGKTPYDIFKQKGSNFAELVNPSPQIVNKPSKAKRSLFRHLLSILSVGSFLSRHLLPMLSAGSFLFSGLCFVLAGAAVISNPFLAVGVGAAFFAAGASFLTLDVILTTCQSKSEKLVRSPDNKPTYLSVCQDLGENPNENNNDKVVLPQHYNSVLHIPNSSSSNNILVEPLPILGDNSSDNIMEKKPQISPNIGYNKSP